MGVDKRRAFPKFELFFFPFKVAGSYFELNTEPVVYIGGCRQPSRIESNRVWRRLGPFELIFFRLPRISGGAAPPHSTLDFTRGHFSSGLVGCVKDISIQVPQNSHFCYVYFITLEICTFLQNVSISAFSSNTESSSSSPHFPVEVTGLNVEECEEE